MKSVADELREVERQKLARMTVSERLALALRLGDDDLELFAKARNIDRESASARLRSGRQKGRRPSRCFDAARVERRLAELPPECSDSWRRIRQG